MAKKFLVALDLNRNELQNIVLQNLSVAPENPVNGMTFYDTANNCFKFRENGAWVSFATTTALASKADAATTIAGYGITDAYTKTEVDALVDAKDSLPAQSGHSGEWLTTNGSTASWATLPIATDQVAGVVKQGQNITIGNDGTISATVPVTSVNGQTGAVTVASILDDNTKTTMLKLWVGTKQQYDAITTKDEHTIYYIQKDGQAIDIYELLEAKQDKLNAGTNISLTPEQDGTVTIANTYTLPTAASDTLGGVKVGTNLSIDANGVLSANVPVTSVAGKTGVVTLDKSDVGLGNVDNTADLDKPISTLTQAALDLKANAATTLAGYGITDAYTKTEVDGLVSSVYKYKGSVATVDDLPASGNTEGDVYNVEATGDNYAWVAPDPEDPEDEGHWDKLAGTVDLSAYSTTAQIAATYLTQTDAASTYLAQTDAASTYATKEELGQVAQGSVHKVAFTNTALTPTSGVATWEISHSLGADVDVTIKEVATGDEIMADVTFANNLVTIKMNATSEIAAGTYKAVVLG